ncbi:MAG TPA: inner membrane CreD family protein, partial [Variovorax sp.]|nr:inner membrane CreD family protein [Variovorax sp.]
MKSVLFEKLAALAAVVVALLLALHAVDGVVQERRVRQQGAAQEVASSLAGDQTLLGPMLRRQCQENWTSPDGTGTGANKTPQHREFTQILWPRRLSVNSHVAVEPRHRGLFKVNGYLSETTLEAEWRPFDPSSSAATRPFGRVSCQPPTVALVLGDVRGIRSASVTVDGIDREVRSGSAVGEASGLHAALPELPKDGAPVHAVVKLALVGTGSLAWTPVGDESTVDIDADWPHPSFAGQFLPVTREVTARGFRAGWRVGSLASGARQQYRAGGRVCSLQDGRADGEAPASATKCADSFGVRFIDPVNPYVLSERALKY